MSEETQTKPCASCGKTLIQTSNGWVHEGGGVTEQLCRNCGWRGGQAGGYSACPRCGDQTQLAVDHTAS